MDREVTDITNPDYNEAIAELEEIWASARSIALFIKMADKSGYGLWSIRDFLREKEFEITEEEIDEIRL